MFVKVCGVTTAEDASMAVLAGVDAVGVNFWPKSARCVEPGAARAIVEAVAGRAVVVGVFVDAAVETITALRAGVGFDRAQLHGSETPEEVSALAPWAFKALHVGDEAIGAVARRYGGEWLLLDTLVRGERGGTGRTFDWRLATVLSRERDVLLAGGLTIDNVATAIAQVRPFGVDVASGVERTPGVKDPTLVRAFVSRARAVR